jgi:hypothetical protein
VTDPDPGALRGIAVTGLTGAVSGTWEFSTDGGTTWRRLGAPSPLAARLLRAEDRVRFRPDAGFTGTAAIRYRAWDQTAGTAGLTAAVGAGGGRSAFSLATETATVLVV